MALCIIPPFHYSPHCLLRPFTGISEETLIFRLYILGQGSIRSEGIELGVYSHNGNAAAALNLCGISILMSFDFGIRNVMAYKN